MKFITKLTFLNFFITTTAFGADFQYFLSPYFFKNPQSYWVNGNQNIKYNLGELFSTAINQTDNNLLEKGRLFEMNMKIFINFLTLYFVYEKIVIKKNF